jgi:hypothetical protein
MWIFSVKRNKETFPHPTHIKTGSLVKANKEISCTAGNGHISVNKDLLERDVSSKPDSIHLFLTCLVSKRISGSS